MGSTRIHGIGSESALVPYDGWVHHYTSGDGLLQIVSTGQLRVSEASSLNDLAEVKLGWKAVETWLALNASGSGAEHLRRLLAHLRRDPKHQVFILSGTTLGDDANQWRLYAEQGRGYAIGFDGAVPLGVVSLDPAEDTRGGRVYGRVTEFATVVPWFHVLYDEGDLAAAVTAAAEYAERDLKRIDALGDEDYKEFEYERLNEKLTDELAMIAHLYKSAGFSGEKEVRVVARFLWFGNHVGYHASRYGIAGHIHLVRARDTLGSLSRVIPAPSMDEASSPGFQHPLAITGVRLGPLIHKSNRKTVQALLRSHGLRDAAVKRSQVPLR